MYGVHFVNLQLTELRHHIFNAIEIWSKDGSGMSPEGNGAICWDPIRLQIKLRSVLAPQPSSASCNSSTATFSLH